MKQERRKTTTGSVIFLVILTIIFVGIVVGNSNRPTTESYITNTQPATTVNNIENQNACINEAQSEVNNDPQYQPVGGDSTSYSLSQQSKALAMQPKIDACKTQYPTN